MFGVCPMPERNSASLHYSTERRPTTTTTTTTTKINETTISTIVSFSVYLFIIHLSCCFWWRWAMRCRFNYLFIQCRHEQVRKSTSFVLYLIVGNLKFALEQRRAHTHTLDRRYIQDFVCIYSRHSYFLSHSPSKDTATSGKYSCDSTDMCRHDKCTQRFLALGFTTAKVINTWTWSHVRGTSIPDIQF